MEDYRYLQLAYLIIPFCVGVEFFLSARTERKRSEKGPARALALDAFGCVFAVLIPALIIFTITSLENHLYPFLAPILHRLDRYCVMFFYLGAWWQIFLFTALRAKRAENLGKSLAYFVWMPYLILGSFISALELWGAPFGLMWLSVAWFVFTCALLAGFKVSSGKVAKTFWVFSLIIVFCENLMFIVLDAII